MAPAQNVLVIGGGFVGSIIARDLAASGYATTVGDIDASLEAALAPHGVKFMSLDCTDAAAVTAAASAADLVVGCVPSRFGLAMLRAVVEAGRPCVDISFTPEDVFAELGELARARGATVVFDCGVAPGIPNMLYGGALAEARAAGQALNRADYYVGGLPVDEGVNGDWGYFSLFNVHDAIDEFVRPARFKLNGEIRTEPAGSGRFMKDFSHVAGRPMNLECWNSDGLRSMLRLPVPNMKEMTLRYPGHVEKMVAMREAGEFAPGPELDAAAKRLLGVEWTRPEGAKDCIVMEIEVEQDDGKKWSYRVYDEMENEIPAMSRCTGYMATSTLDVLAQGLFTQAGVFALEHVGAEKPAFDALLEGLNKRGVSVTRHEQ